jgi:hypothetical protein
VALEKLKSHLGKFFAAARAEHDAHRSLPSLALVYTIIDILGSLERVEGEGTRKSFVRWVDSYLLPNAGLPCNALDLYAARCGILHALTPEADLVKKGEARRLAYAWGTGSAEDLREIGKRLERSDVVAIHVGDLISGVHEALDRYLSAVSSDAKRLAEIDSRSSQWFAMLPLEIATQYLARTGGQTRGITSA